MMGSGVFVAAKVTVDDWGRVGDEGSCRWGLVVEEGLDGAE